MNFGQFIEGYISKAITKSESLIKQDNDNLIPELYKISQISDVLKDTEYANQIRLLAENIKNNSDLKNQFLRSIDEIGLYFEAPGFANFQLKDLEDKIIQNWNVNSQEPIHISKDCIEFIQDTLKINNLPSCPNEGVILPNIFCAPIYTLKLKQEAYYRSSARDFGSYKSNNYQPVQGRSTDGFIGGSARLGQMEFDGLLAHSTLRVIKELRTVKNDNRELKTDMVHQIISNGEYNMPDNNNSQSFTKTIIESFMNFLND